MGNICFLCTQEWKVCETWAGKLSQMTNFFGRFAAVWRILSNECKIFMKMVCLWWQKKHLHWMPPSKVVQAYSNHSWTAMWVNNDIVHLQILLERWKWDVIVIYISSAVFLCPWNWNKMKKGYKAKLPKLC